MSSIDKTFVKKSFNAGADTYDRHAGLQNYMGEHLLKLVYAESPALSRVLDVGMGTGNLTARLMERFPLACVHGCDIAINMLRRAWGKVPPSTGGRAFIAADAESLPYKGLCFDLVASSFTYQWLEDWSSALEEARRVLKPGGVFLFSAFGSHTFLELRQSYRQACLDTGYSLGQALELAGTEEKITAGLAGCGFTAPLINSFSIVEKYSSVNDLIKSIKGMGARNASTRRNKTPGVRKIWKRMVELYERDFRTQDTIPATFEIFMGKAKKPPQ